MFFPDPALARALGALDSVLEAPSLPQLLARCTQGCRTQLDPRVLSPPFREDFGDLG